MTVLAVGSQITWLWELERQMWRLVEGERWKMFIVREGGEI
jgi:hypothetical protein